LSQPDENILKEKKQGQKIKDLLFYEQKKL
jgi:hypothetical protein